MASRRPHPDLESESGISSRASTNFYFPKQRNEQFSIEEPTTKQDIWYQWLRTRVKHYMVLEGVFFIILLVVLTNSYRTNSNSEKVLEIVSNIESRIMNLEKRIELLSNGQISRPHQSADTLMETVESPKPVKIQPQSIQSVFESETKPQKLESSPKSASVSLFNAANYLVGASVDSSRSSSSNLSPFLTWDQTGLVLLDRPEPPVDKAWCTSDKHPVLTVNLAKYVKPVAVSYQHSKWYGVIPSGAPRKYSVWACLDYYCEDMQPLVSNCEYKETSDYQQEQLCQIKPHKNFTSIVKVQFQFHENHGNAEETCVNLVRVYGEAENAPKLRERKVEDAEICSDLKHSFHHNPIAYSFSHKNCTVLYTKQCCGECPECCEKCKIEDFNSRTIEHGVLSVIIVTIFSILALMVIGVCATCCKACITGAV